MFKAKRGAVDVGLQLIARYQTAIVQARMDHLRSAIGYSLADLEQERVTVEALAARIGDGLRAEYARRSR